MATIIYIECDGCGSRSPDDWRNAGQTIRYGVRPALESQGWKAFHNRQLDYCPRCVAAGKCPKERPKKTTT